MRKLDLSKILFYSALIITISFLLIFFGLYSGVQKNFLYKSYRSICRDLIIFRSELSTLTKKHPTHFLQPARRSGSEDGVVLDKVGGTDLILLSGFFEGNNQIQLIRRDGSMVNRWVLSYSAIFPDPDFLHSPPKTDWNVDIHGVLALEDGSVLFNFEYAGLVKLNNLGDVVWRLRRPTHHSIERAVGGGFWVPSRKLVKSKEEYKLPFPPPYNMDTIIKVSEDGVVLREISVPQLLVKNGLEPLLSSTGEIIEDSMTWDQEIVHVNKVAELGPLAAEKFSMFEVGDLIVSIRQYNMIFVFDPVQEVIKWWKIGPWLRQHDPEFNPDGSITVFNNNSYYISDYKKFKSNIIRINPDTNESQVVLGNDSHTEFYTKVRGKHELTQTGGFLVTEFEGCRVFETDKSGNIIWEYINKYDDDECAEITEARIYTAEYFTAEAW